MNPTEGRERTVWGDLVAAHNAFMTSSHAFLSEGVDRAGFVREALASGRDKQTVCYLLPYLKPQELRDLFDVLVEWASTGHGLVKPFREAIVSLPREWVLPRIESAAEPYLRDGTDDEYRRFLELYLELDRELTSRLANRAVNHPDPDVREAGEEYLGLLRSVKSEVGIDLPTVVVRKSLRNKMTG